MCVNQHPKAAKVPTGSGSEPVSLEANAAIPPAGLPEGRSTAHPYRDYLKSNALKGRRFESLTGLNEHLKRWNRNIASLRIHGTTKRQVISHFLEAEKGELGPLPSSPFEHFSYGKRIVHFDGHIRVGNAFYSVPHHLLREEVEVRFTDRILKIYHSGELVAVHAISSAGMFVTADEHRPAEKPAKAEGYERWLLARAQRVGEGALAWARGAIAARGPRSYRLMQGMLALTGKHAAEAVNWTCEIAHENSCYHYRSLKKLVERAAEGEKLPELSQTHELIRPLSEIGEEVRTIERRA